MPGEEGALLAMAAAAAASAEPPSSLAPHGGPLKVGDQFYEKLVTSGNRWGFPTPQVPDYCPPPPAPAAPPAKRVPWWKSLCDPRWLLSVRAAAPLCRERG